MTESDPSKPPTESPGAGRPAPFPRTSCSVAKALELLGDRWTLRVVRDLLLDGEVTFSHLETTVAGANPSTLSNRLKRLEAAELVTRVPYSTHPPRAAYRLTEKGRELAPVVDALRTFGDLLGGERGA